MESVKSQGYNLTEAEDGEAFYSKISSYDIPDGYTICSVDRNGVPVNCDPGDAIIAIPWDSDNDDFIPPGEGDDGLQKITLVIMHEDQTIFTLEGYKLDR